MPKEDTTLALQEMIRIFTPDGTDWMGCPITKDNPLTFHHIWEEKNGGPTIASNGALLTKKSHQKLVKIKNKNPLLYDFWQELFREINDTMMAPTTEHKERMKALKEDSNNLIYGKGK